jgi:ABC-type glycerol-3-phosphate transport system substrate-binding protein
MQKTLTILTLVLSLGACSNPVSIQADRSAICEALRPDMPIQYHGSTTDAETKANIQRANARYTAACGK